MARKAKQEPRNDDTEDVVVSVKSGRKSSVPQHDTDPIEDRDDDDSPEDLEEDTVDTGPPIYKEPYVDPQGVRASPLARTALSRFDPFETQVQLSEHWVYQDHRFKRDGRI